VGTFEAAGTVERCESCGGAGFIRGIFHRMSCATCDGVGVLGGAVEPVQATAAPLAPAARLTGPGADYVGNSNKYRRGGGNWTGD
jgi:hypothetical protein